MRSVDTDSQENKRITLELLAAVEAGRARTQRGLAEDLGIALGLVNVYLKRCVKKGLVKVSQAPARRYAYYLTPQGFAEKSRLTGEFLAWSLTFFRQAKASCGQTLDEAHARGWRRMALAGSGDLADIARICAADRGIEILAVVDPEAAATTGGSVQVLRNFDDIGAPIDGIMITDIGGNPALRAEAERTFGRHRVLRPSVVPAVPSEGAAVGPTVQRAEEVEG